MSFNRPRYWVGLAFSLLISSRAAAAWTDQIQGLPALDFFSARAIGRSGETSVIVQDKLGRIFVASDGLLVFDGASWKSYPLPGTYILNSLSFGPDGRLWAGGFNQLGYYSETTSGEFVFTSLLAKLPFEERVFGNVWGCGVVDGQVYFICKSKILRWDGVVFRIWDYPTELRLFPVHLGNELWFTHSETGLYRLTQEGPHREFASTDLPPHVPFWLERRGIKLLLVSRDGVFYAGQPDHPLCSKDVIDFLSTNAMSSVAGLPDGSLALGTLGGIGIMSADRKLIRTLRHEDGMPGNLVNGLFLDREKELWITSSSGSGIARIDAKGSVSVFREWRQTSHTYVTSLVSFDNTVLAATDSGVYRLEKRSGESSRFTPMEDLPSSCSALSPWKSGLLICSFGRLEYFDGLRTSLITSLTSTSFYYIKPSAAGIDTFYALENQNLARLQRLPDGEWQNEVLCALPDYATSFYVDPQDNLWINSASQGVWRFDTRARRLSAVHGDLKPGMAMQETTLTGRNEKVYFMTGHKAYVADARTGFYRQISGFPPVMAYACTLSPDGRRLYVAFQRYRDDSTATSGIGIFALDERGEPSAWTELDVPKLEAAGVPLPLLVTDEDGDDALWIGGSEGVVRIKAEELSPVRAPSRPWLQVYDTSGRPAIAGSEPSYAFGHHHLVIQAGSSEIDERKDLWFQTRLGGPETDWSPPSPRSTFEFTNLVDGAYTFELRAVNSAGLVSETATYDFRILPPWFRTPWAYGGYILAGALGVFGFVRIRERQIRAHNQALETLVRRRTGELVKANAAKDEFLAGISHEIRNPLNGVVGLASTLDTSRLSETDRQRVGNLRHCANHLSGLLEDILDFSKLEAGAVSLHAEPFDLPGLMESLVGITATQSAEAGIPVEVAVSPAVPRYLIGDAARLRQILLNFVINGLKYSGRGKVSVTVWCQQAKPAEADLTFAVSDDGPGIAPEEQARLFTRFERGAAAAERRVAGTGLGLAMCKTLAEKMGGHLEVESALGEGSTFSLKVTLPLAEPPAQPAPPVRELATNGTLHALVVDDEEYNRLALSAFLEQAGFDVTTACESEEALAAARSEDFQAVFLDVNLPGKSGLDVARELRAMPGMPPALPIIATTAFTTADKRAQCLAAGMDAFLTKPVSLSKVRAALTAATATRRATAPFHPPGEPEPADPLGTLRLLAARKGVPLAAELALYFKELESEASLLSESLRLHDAAATADVAHRLVGRLAFVRAHAAEEYAREVEISAVNELWDRTVEAGRRLAEELPSLRIRLTAVA